MQRNGGGPFLDSQICSLTDFFDRGGIQPRQSEAKISTHTDLFHHAASAAPSAAKLHQGTQ